MAPPSRRGAAGRRGRERDKGCTPAHCRCAPRAAPCATAGSCCCMGAAPTTADQLTEDTGGLLLRVAGGPPVAPARLPHLRVSPPPRPSCKQPAGPAVDPPAATGGTAYPPEGRPWAACMLPAPAAGGICLGWWDLLPSLAAARWGWMSRRPSHPSCRPASFRALCSSTDVKCCTRVSAKAVAMAATTTASENNTDVPGGGGGGGPC